MKVTAIPRPRPRIASLQPLRFDSRDPLDLIP